MNKLSAPYKALALFAVTLLATSAAHATVLYSNGPYNGQGAPSSAPNITDGNYAKDSFTIGTSSTVTGIEFVSWNYPPGNTIVSVDWAIFSGLPVPYTASPLIASGTGVVTSTFLLDHSAGGYDVYSDTFDITGLALSSGTYSLGLYDALAGTHSDDLRWDTNGGPSIAVIHTNFGPFDGYGASQSFQVLGSSASTSVAEPDTLGLMALGLVLVGFATRRRRQ
ncbi:MAG: PEP-CTERM sorting domain-containing protein [Rhodanobacter sp.]